MCRYDAKGRTVSLVQKLIEAQVAKPTKSDAPQARTRGRGWQIAPYLV